MSTYSAKPGVPVNNNGGSYSKNYLKTEKSSITEFGIITPESYAQTEINFLNNFVTRDNNANNIRRTLTESAIRQDGWDWYSWQFAQGFPLNSNYNFCDSSDAIVFSAGGSQYTRKTDNNVGYPFSYTISKVSDAVQNTQPRKRK